LIYFFFGFAAFSASAFVALGLTGAAFFGRGLFALGFAGAALPFAAAFNAAPAENLGTFFAAILISLPVWGFLPFLAFREATENVPNPIRVTFFMILALDLSPHIRYSISTSWRMKEWD
jgi:hypothetical protein